MTETKSRTQEEAAWLVEQFLECRRLRRDVIWIEGGLLYELDRKGEYAKTGLKSKQELYKKLGIPTSTAQFILGLYEFYVVKHKIPIEKLNEVGARVLGILLPKLRYAGTRRVYKKLNIEP